METFKVPLNKAKTLLKEYPDSPTLYNICGITYSDLDKYEDALDNFYLALQISQITRTVIIIRETPYKPAAA